MATSSLDDLAHGGFQQVIDETDAAIAKKADKVLLCSGKLYYDLCAARTAKGISDTAIVRVEQLYPDLEGALAPVLGR